MLCTVAGIEEAADVAEADKGVVEGGFEEAVAVAVDERDRGFRGDADVVRLDADEGPVTLVGGVDGGEAAREAALVEEPGV